VSVDRNKKELTMSNENFPRIVQRLSAQLLQRKKSNKLRGLKESLNNSTTENMLDFSSNDYLGLSRNVALVEKIKEKYDEFLSSQTSNYTFIGTR
jgi:7-keto-8-aminopelargonate synthetase-like enzyme